MNVYINMTMSPLWSTQSFAISFKISLENFALHLTCRYIADGTWARPSMSYCARYAIYFAELPWRGFRVLNTSNLFPLHHIMVIKIRGLNRFPLFVWSFVKSPTNDLGSRVRLQLFVTRKVNTNKVLNSDCHKKELVKLCQNVKQVTSILFM